MATFDIFPAMDKHPVQGSRNTTSRFVPQKPGTSSSSYDPVGSNASFTFFFCRYIQIHLNSDAKRTKTKEMKKYGHLINSIFFTTIMIFLRLSFTRTQIQNGRSVFCVFKFHREHGKILRRFRNEIKPPFSDYSRVAWTGRYF